MKPVTMEDIARQAGVSRTSVWMALRNHPRIKESTATKLQKLAESMGYHPNPLVSAHMSNVRRGRAGTTTTTLAYVSTENEDQLDNQPHRLWWIEGVRTRATKLGYGFQRFSVDGKKMSPKRMEDILRARGIRGIVFGVWEKPEIRLNWTWSNFACVKLDDTDNLPPFHTVRVSDYDITSKAWSYARAKGYRRIGLMIDEVSDERSHYRSRAAFLAQESMISAKERIPLMSHARGKGWSQENFSRWLEQNRPDCLIVRNPEVYSWVIQTGRSVPADIGYIGMVSPHPGKVPHVRRNTQHLTTKAVDMLDGALRRNEIGIPQDMVVLNTQCFIDEEGS